MFQYNVILLHIFWKPIFANIKKYWKSTGSVLGFVVLGGKILQNVKLYDSNCLCFCYHFELKIVSMLNSI